MTPDRLEEKYNEVENYVTSWLSRRSEVFLTFSLVVVLVISFLTINNQLTFRYPFLYFTNFIFSFKTILLLSSLSLFFLYFKKLDKNKFFWASIFILGASFDFWQSRWFLRIKEWSALFFIFYQVALGYFTLKIYNAKNKYYVIAGYLFIVVTLLVWVRLYTNSSGWYYFHQPVLFSAFVVGFILEGVKLNSDKLWPVVLNPAHLFLSVNYPIDQYLYTDSFSQKKVWSSGLVDFAKAMLALFLTVTAYHTIPEDDLGVYLGAGKEYLLYLLVVIAVGNTITGLSKLFLIDVPKCSNFVFLSRSPLDFLKRENAHAYAFSLRFFYFNFLKYTKNPLVIVLGYFLIFPFYRNVLVFFSRAEQFQWIEFGIFLMWGYLFWFLLLVAIIIYPQKIINRFRVGQWIQVLITHGMFLIVFILYKMVYLQGNG